ncbi:hypothetical protein N8I84_42130 (plasmid) [Streptomyces cynarae]|uniref:Uncharacterized protein n=1 Tax=Streptomyces cynarae TaxID=2981134 RepID=A0ABY6EGK9_9ACTN|nr:hypothetical protein [Streptomyces cynarae]UXY25028.1 hypothetical protein N8I84_42130 [Streptomyces cynarae]
MSQQRATLQVEITFDGHQDPRDLVPTARLWIGESLDGRTGVTGWRITGRTEAAIEEPAR